MRMSRRRHIRRKQTCFLDIQTRIGVLDNFCRALEVSEINQNKTELLYNRHPGIRPFVGPGSCKGPIPSGAIDFKRNFFNYIVIKLS